MKNVLAIIGAIAIFLMLSAYTVRSLSMGNSNKGTVYIEKADGCEYVIVLSYGSGTAVTHHGACDNPKCNFKSK